ncbi:restriction endonuclease subunit S [Atopobiaceae bacterium Sow4_H2]
MRVKLGDVCLKIGSGATPKGGKNVYLDSGVTFIRSQNVFNLSFDVSGLTYISVDAAEKLRGVSVEAEDVLLNITGDSVARVCVAPSDLLPARVNQHVAIIRVDKSRLLSRYLAYYLASPLMQSYMLNRAAGKGASRNAITKQMIEGFEIPAPDLEIQRRIAGVLSAYDELIENSRRQIKLLVEATQRLYKEWFIDLKFPGHETTPIVDGLPEGWRKATLGELSVLITRGITPRYSETSDFLVLGQRCVRGNLVDLSCARRCERKGIAEQKMLKCGDVLINSTGTGSLGRTAQVWFDPIEMTADSHVTIVRASSPELSSYLAQWAFANESFIESLHTGSTGQTELPRGRVSSIRVLVPSPRALNQFNNFVSPMVGKVNMLQRNIAEAREARDRLLPKLMSGEIEV